MYTLQSVRYSEFAGSDREWSIYFELDKANLFVGRNASGKTRALNIISNLAKDIRGERKTSEGQHALVFCNEDGHQIEYVLNKRDGTVLQETLTINDEIMLDRDTEGRGKIYSEEFGKHQRFGIPPDMPAIFAKRDFQQHPFLEPIFTWASGIRYYPFAGELGYHSFIAIRQDAPKPDPKDAGQTNGVFKRGLDEYGDAFINAVTEAMQQILYPITDIELGTPTHIRLKNVHDDIFCLKASERSVASPVWQFEMSTGMFRSLATIIHLAYAKFSSSIAAVVIDDIGEGLDFERSKRLTKHIIETCNEIDCQLIMATNDRFIMNSVPLEMWKGVKRTGSTVDVISPKTEPDLFGDFATTGLSNFDFFASHIFGDNE